MKTENRELNSYTLKCCICDLRMNVQAYSVEQANDIINQSGWQLNPVDKPWTERTSEQIKAVQNGEIVAMSAYCPTHQTIAVEQCTCCETVSKTESLLEEIRDLLIEIKEHVK